MCLHLECGSIRVSERNDWFLSLRTWFYEKALMMNSWSKTFDHNYTELRRDKYVINQREEIREKESNIRIYTGLTKPHAYIQSLTQRWDFHYLNSIVQASPSL